MFQSMRDKTLKKSKAKTVALSLTIAASMSLPLGAYAQDGLFQRGVTDEMYYGHGSTNGLMNKNDGFIGGNLNGQFFGATNSNLTGQTFGAPLGSGLFVLLAAGASYSVLKSKKTQRKNQNRKEN